MSWVDTLHTLLTEAPPTERFASFATVDAGGHPRARYVVVRALDSGGGAPRVTFSADARSAKLTEVAHEARAELCWFIGSRWVQFRLAGRARRLVDDTVRQAAWDATSVDTRAQVLGGPPGLPADTPFEPAGAATDPAPPATFAMVALEVDEVDVVDLSVKPTRRTRWTREADGWVSLDVHA